MFLVFLSPSIFLISPRKKKRKKPGFLALLSIFTSFFSFITFSSSLGASSEQETEGVTPVLDPEDEEKKGCRQEEDAHGRVGGHALVLGAGDNSNERHQGEAASTVLGGKEEEMRGKGKKRKKRKKLGRGLEVLQIEATMRVSMTYWLPKLLLMTSLLPV